MSASALAALVVWLLKLVAVIGIPILLIEFGSHALRRAAPPAFFQVPLITALAKLLGIALGLLLLYTRYDGSYFDLHRIFVPASPWNLSAWEFLAERADPLLYGPGSLYDFLARGGADDAFALLAAAVLGLAAATIAAGFLVWRRDGRRRAILCALATALLTAYITIYGVCLLFWLLFLLNFWTFAVMGALFQYYRKRA
jgi:hypothetical protein